MGPCFNYTMQCCGIAHFDADLDPDPVCFFGADPDSACHFDAYSYRDPDLHLDADLDLSLQKKAQDLKKVFK
jgi:hypothetical protein